MIFSGGEQELLFTDKDFSCRERTYSLSFVLANFSLPPIRTYFVFTDPVTDVINLARAHGKDRPLLLVTLGDVTSLERALSSIKMGMKTGCWVILENCHLAAYWSDEFVHELQASDKL